MDPVPGKSGSSSWDVQAPVFTDVDLVSHSGNSGEGEFVHTLNPTDTHTGWAESRGLLGKSEIAVQETLDEIRTELPFRLLGVDSDNGSEFIWHLKPEAVVRGEANSAHSRPALQERR
jgi:hypothetical protein